MTTPQTLRDLAGPEVVLRRAAALIRERGWAKDESEEDWGDRNCAWTAILEVAPMNTRPAITLLATRIGAGPHDVGAILRWNDSRTSVEEVLAVLDPTLSQPHSAEGGRDE